MSLKLALLMAGMASLVGAALGFYIRYLISLSKKGTVEMEVKGMVAQAEEKASKIVSEAETKATDILKEVRESSKDREMKIKIAEDRLVRKEDALDKKQSDLDKEVEVIKEKIAEIKKIKEKVDSQEKIKNAELEKIAKLSTEEAREQIIETAKKKYEEDILIRLQKLENEGEERLESRAREILTTAIHRLGNSVANDVFSTTVTIPSEDIKGKIIGKEGRNIKTLERLTGVEIIVDDTPSTILISSFDPIRRQVARVALEDLITDGRIQPARIEKAVEEAEKNIQRIIKEKGQQAAYECGVINLDPRIIQVLGRLYFRTSYGQNVLQHSIEMAHIAGMIAEELGVNVYTAKAGALLHDIGKAVDHEVQGTHVEIGRRILQKFGAPEEIIKAMQAHHEEYPYETPESIIVQVADAISGSRPGARRDNVENYLKRLQDLEAIANSFKGVEKTFALQAGREVRVFVTPGEISDLDAKTMARDIADRIEKELRYPGEIKVTIIRETRAVEYAK